MGVVHGRDSHGQAFRGQVEGRAGKHRDLGLFQQSGGQFGAGVDALGGELVPEGFEIRKEVERSLRLRAVKSKGDEGLPHTFGGSAVDCHAAFHFWA